MKIIDKIFNTNKGSKMTKKLTMPKSKFDKIMGLAKKEIQKEMEADAKEEIVEKLRRLENAKKVVKNLEREVEELEYELELD